MNVFINDIASFLPNAPVGNDQIEDLLGRIGEAPSRTRRRILANNKILTRHYALDPETGLSTHTNAQLTAEAVRKLRPTADFRLADIECLCCGSASPDLLLPGHGMMVAGELGLPPCEIMTTAGICLAGVTALKYACLNVAAGTVSNAVATGSEIASSFMKADFFSAETEPEGDLGKKPILGFDADFLRWMLSDGAGAAFVAKTKRASGLCYRVDWIDNLSYAGELPTCMYAGGRKLADGRMQGWREMKGVGAAARENIFAVRQDVKLLDEQVVATATARALPAIAAKRGLLPAEVDWYLPHYSSDYFRDRIYQA
jgi:3-oxoacyl-[acyl-carrier-protein] synthase-3